MTRPLLEHLWDAYRRALTLKRELDTTIELLRESVREYPEEPRLQRQLDSALLWLDELEATLDDFGVLPALAR